MIRSPILVSLGHVDHGKTTLLDNIRGSAIAQSEAGLITQNISATYIPTQVLKNVSGTLLDKLGIDLTIPGLLWIDSPGHEAFTTLRKRGGAIADLAVLVVDATQGFQPQTEESIMYLKQFKTPFVVAMTKIDRINGWNSKENRSFLQALNDQPDRVSAQLEEKLYTVIGELLKHDIKAERYDRVEDYTKQAAIVPVSSTTGEGVPDLLMVLSGIAQRYLKKGLEITPGEGKGTVLEIKEHKGLGTTIDVILYDGEIKRGDHIVVGGHETIKTKIKAILKSENLKDTRFHTAFNTTQDAIAAAGIKISAPGLEGVIAGSPLRAVRNEKDIPKAVKEVEAEVEEVEIQTEDVGYLLKADTLGGLEALVKMSQDIDVSIRRASVGDLTKQDIVEMKVQPKPYIFAFNVKISDDIKLFARDNGVKIFSSDIIYTLIEEHEEYTSQEKKNREKDMLDRFVRPGEVQVLPGYVFRQKNPAVFGVEIVKGMIKSGWRLQKGSHIIGEIKEVQAEGESVKQAKKGERVALSMPDPTIGKDFNEGDKLTVFMTNQDKKNIEKIRDKLAPDEIELLDSAKE